MRYPDEYLWEFPGFFSLTLHYGVRNDFYFSSVVALGVINFSEFMCLKYTKLAIA